TSVPRHFLGSLPVSLGQEVDLIFVVEDSPAFVAFEVATLAVIILIMLSANLDRLGPQEPDLLSAVWAREQELFLSALLVNLIYSKFRQSRSGQSHEVKVF